MPGLRRRPTGPLAAFVTTLWAVDTRDLPVETQAIERVVPSGAMHLVVRLSSDPLVVYDDAHGRGARTIGCAVIGGARSTYYLRDVSRPVCSVGAQLRPGAAQALFGLPATLLAERHTALDDVWPAEAARFRERIGAEPTLTAALARFEALLHERIVGAPRLHPAIAAAFGRVAAAEPIARVVAASGLSHRHFIALFRDTIGLAPKTLARVVRADRARSLLSAPAALADVASRAGYADQAHLTRELVAIAGVTPRRYRALGAPSRHVPIERGGG